MNAPKDLTVAIVTGHVKILQVRITAHVRLDSPVTVLAANRQATYI